MLTDIPATTAVDRVRRVVDLLRERGIDLSGAFESWNSNRPEPRTDHAASRAAADAVSLPFLGESGKLESGQVPKPVVIDGVNPPWLLRRVFDATSHAPDGYAPRLFVVQRDPVEFLEGVSRLDMDDILSSPRVVLAVGEDAAEQLMKRFVADIDLALPGFVIAPPGGVSKVSPTPVIERALAMQEQLHYSLKAQTVSVYSVRDRAWWAHRYAEACAPNSTKPLRILLPISRYSTFVRHSSNDLAQALRDLGHEARVLMEPDDSSKLASPAYLRQFAEWQPDLVILINYTRQHMGQAVIPGVPVVCWIQDAMPQLFSPQVGAAQSDLDFVAGYLPPELFDRFGYRRTNTLNSPVVVSERKFHNAPADATLLREHECEVAYVSHQSEPPESFLARVLATSKPGTPPYRAVELAVPQLEAAIAKAMTARISNLVDDAALGALRAATGADPDPRVVAVFKHQFCAPYAERRFRHETLLWTAEIARKRGWRFKLYGNGWNRHPSLAEFAAGPLEHGEALRASYQAAAVHLHMSTYSVVHQRVMECAMSGGMPACRLQRREIESVCHRLLEDAIGEHAPGAISPNGYEYYWVRDCPSLAKRAAFEKYFGIEPKLSYPVSAAHVRQVKSRSRPLSLFQADLLLGDLRERAFHDSSSLEKLLERSIESRSWRQEVSGSIAKRVREVMTYQAFSRRLLGMLGARLAGETVSDW